MTYLGSLCASPWSTEMHYFYRAENLGPGNRILDPNESIRLGIFPLDQAIQLLVDTQTQGSTIAGLALAGLWKSPPAKP